MRQGRFFLLLLFSVFSLALLGHFFTKEERRLFPLSLTISAQECDNALDGHLPQVPFEATIDGIPCTVLGYERIPHRKRDPVSGKTFLSRLSSDLIFRITLMGEKREGVYYGDGKYLSVGKTACFSSPYFEANVLFLSIKEE